MSAWANDPTSAPLLPCQPALQGIESPHQLDALQSLPTRTAVQEAHLNIIKDSLGNYFVEVAQGADRITLTPPLWSTTEASEALRRIASVTGLRTGRTV